MPPPPSVRPTQGLGLWNGLMTLKVTTWTRHLALSQGGYRGIDLPVAGLNITACRSAMCRAENVRVDGGLLRLQSDRDPSDSSRYFSAAVTTKDRVSWSAQPAPFRLCVRAKLLLNTKGVWPAHWMLPENGYSDQCLDEGEMDITEMVSGDGTVYNTYHWMSSWPQQRCAKFDTYHKSAASSRRIRSYSSDFHEYAVERSMDHISYAVDGKVVGRFSSEEHGFQISSSPFFLILNTAIGGAWPGSPQPDETRMPVTMPSDWDDAASHLPKKPQESLEDDMHVFFCPSRLHGMPGGSIYNYMASLGTCCAYRKYYSNTMAQLPNLSFLE
ncbi:unnamed protein product [Durusdinium trenchii]|uniref:GH16 domain-containing protein n=1 Tax=Durusdinium trenchii TaxID=1381693 RepID=A0ABP0IK25_9DINO